MEDTQAYECPKMLFGQLLTAKVRRDITRFAKEDAHDLFSEVLGKPTQLNGFRTVCASYGFGRWIEYLEKQGAKRTSVWAKRRSRGEPAAWERVRDRIRELESGGFWNDQMVAVRDELNETSIGRSVTIPGLNPDLKLALGRLYMDEIISRALLRVEGGD